MSALQVEDTDFLILCGGLGTRLQSVVSDRPKALASIGSVPFLDIQIRYLKRQGACRFVLCTGHRGQDIARWVEQTRHLAGQVVLSQEPHPLGTGGAVSKAVSAVRTDHFFVLNGDSFCTLHLERMLELHCLQRAQVTMAVTWVEDTSSFGLVKIDSTGAVVAFEEKRGIPSPGGGWINAGVYLFDRQEFVRHAPSQPVFSLERDFFPARLDGSLHAYQTESQMFLDIGTPTAYAKAQSYLAAYGREE